MFSQTWSIRVDKMVGTFNPKYTYTKRGIYYFCKDVPADLRHHYTKLRIVQSLRTKSSTRAKAAGACWKKGINKTQFDAITEATWRRWPRLELFTGWTHQGQNLEGQILKKVLLQGVDAGIVCLPVHDAVAVQRRHVDWAVEAMTNAWAEIAYGLRPKVKVE
jgi:hypothetical protein